MADVPRELFRERVRSYERPDFIPMNFFLFNRRAACSATPLMAG
jgi:hypothetical protein